MNEASAPEGTPTAARTPSLEQAIASSVVSVFATPLVNHLWPDSDALNRELAELVLRVSSSHPGIQRSNVGGWHSTLDFMNWDFECVRTLRGRLQRFVAELTRRFLRPLEPGQALHFELDGWANVLRHGQYCSLHSHPNSFWSGVYYVTANPGLAEHPQSGKLELVDPRPGASTAYAEHTTLSGRLLLSPAAGQMVIFPAWLQHCVHPYFGAGERISIAFNVRFDVRKAEPA